MSFTISNALKWWSREYPERLAIQVDDRTVSYGDLWTWTARIAGRLHDLGVGPGDRICIMGTNSMEFAVLMLGAMRLGAISAPLNFRSTPREINETLQSLTPKLFYADAERMAVAAESLGEDQVAMLRSLDEMNGLHEGPVPVIDHFVEADDVLFIIGTSGSTGKPKGTIYSHRTVMTWGAEFALMEPTCGNGGRFLSLGPFSASSGTLHLMELIGIGNSIFIQSHFDAELALRWLQDHRITTFIGVPIFFERIAALPQFHDADLSALHFAQTAGARIPMELLAAWRHKGIILRQAYGCTEAGGAWAARDDSAIPSPEKAGHGGIFSEFAIRDVDGDGFAPTGKTGEILVRSASVTPGYWRNPEATAEAIKDGWLHTGDLGMIDENGNLTFIDRLKDIIISGGLNISAMEVERTVAEVPGIVEVAVIALNDSDFGETPLAIVHGDAARFTVEDIIAHCRTHLAGFKVPRYVAVEDQPLPRLPAGKISKIALRDKYRDAATWLPRAR